MCRELFEKKTRDYGTSWRVLRLPSLTDQIFIKASRIRSVQETGENKVGDDVRDEFVAMVNYAVMALVQQQLEGGGEPLELPLERTMELYDKHLGRTIELMMDKKFGTAGDKIVIEDNDGMTLVSEGVEGGYMDIINYSLFCLVRLSEE